MLLTASLLFPFVARQQLAKLEFSVHITRFALYDIIIVRYFSLYNCFMLHHITDSIVYDIVLYWFHFRSDFKFFAYILYVSLRYSSYNIILVLLCTVTQMFVNRTCTILIFSTFVIII